MSRRKEPAIPADLLDQLLAGTDAATALDQGGLLDSLRIPGSSRAVFRFDRAQHSDVISRSIPI